MTHPKPIQTKVVRLGDTPSNADPAGPRICHMADIHLGYRRYNKVTKGGMNQREVDVNFAFQEAITRIIACRPDLVIIAGDLFHAVRPSNAVVTFCFRQLRRLQQDTGAPIVLVGGNHEAPKRVDTGSPLRLMAEIPGVYVADSQAERFSFPEKSISVQCLPHAAIQNVERLPELRADDRVKYNILSVHAQVEEEWVSDFGGVTLALQQLKPHEWDYIALGHVHLHRQVGLTAVYSGAIEHTAANIWSEAKSLKGFLEVNLASSRRTFHSLTSPREVVVLDPIDAEEMEPDIVSTAIEERLDNVPGGIEGKIIRLEVVNLAKEAYRYLDHKMLRQVRAKALSFTLDVKSAAMMSSAGPRAVEKRASLKEELETFCTTLSVPEGDRSKISKLLLEYLTAIEAAHEAA